MATLAGPTLKGVVLLSLLVSAAGLRHTAITARTSRKELPRSTSLRMAAASSRCGMLVVGLAGNNGVTLLAGQIANRDQVTWESSRDGPKVANCLGCITQVGRLSKQFEFSTFADLAVGGWDVVPTKLGEALYQSRVLEYDLVRQVRSEMDALPVMRGVWDADFYGDSQHAGATHIAPEATRLAQLARLREDIRRFKADEEIGSGHVTVVWSASVERPCEEYETAQSLLDAISNDDSENVSCAARPRPLLLGIVALPAPTQASCLASCFASCLASCLASYIPLAMPLRVPVADREVFAGSRIASTAPLCSTPQRPSLRDARLSTVARRTP